MAVDFLSAASAHGKRFFKEVSRRRTIVAEYLESTDSPKPFTLRYGRRKEIVERLHNEGIDATVDDVTSDAQVFRYAYRYLTGELQDQDLTDERLKQHYMVGVRSLRERCIQKWEQIDLSKASRILNKPPNESNGTNGHTIQIFTDVRVVARQQEEQQRIRDEQQRLRQIQQEKIQTLSELLQGAVVKAKALEENNIELTSTAVKLQAENIEMAEAISLHSEDIKFRDEYIYHLEAEEKNAKFLQLEKLADSFPEYPSLFREVQKIKSLRIKNRELQAILEKQLPATFKWPNQSGTTNYMGHFLDGLARLQEVERDHVMNAVRLLTESGISAGPLRSKVVYKHSIPHTPRGAYFSRATDSIRFTWKKHENTIVLYWIYRRGDSRIQMSEA